MSEDDPIEQARRERAAKERAETEAKERIAAATKEHAERLQTALQGKCGGQIFGAVKHPSSIHRGRTRTSKQVQEWVYLLALYATDLREEPYQLLCVQPVKSMGKDAEGRDTFCASESPDAYYLYESHDSDSAIGFSRDTVRGPREILYPDFESAIRDAPRQVAQIYLKAEAKLKQEREQKERTAASHQRMADRKIEAKKARYRKFLPIYIALIPLGVIAVIAALVL